MAWKRSLIYIFSHQTCLRYPSQKMSALIRMNVVNIFQYILCLSRLLHQYWLWCGVVYSRKESAAEIQNIFGYHLSMIFILNIDMTLLI